MSGCTEMDLTADRDTPGDPTSGRPPGPALAFAVLGFMGLATFVWAMIWLGTEVRLLHVAAIIAAPVGAGIAWLAKRWWPFFLGVAVTLITPMVVVVWVLLGSGGD